MRRVEPTRWMWVAVVLALGGCGDEGGATDDGGTGADDGRDDDAVVEADGDDAGADGDVPDVAIDDGGVSDADVGSPRRCPDDGHLEPVVGENVGVPSSVRLEDLPPNDGDFHRITAPGTVIDGRRIDACVVIEADDVVLRNSHVRCTIQGMDGEPYVGAVKVASSARNALIEHCTLECHGADPDRENCRYGIDGGNLVARFNDVFGGTDGFTVFENATFECNFVHDLPRRPVGYQPDGYSHNDGVQGFSGYSVVRGNYFRGDTMDNGQGIFYQTESFSDEPVEAVIENNYLTGFWKNIINCNHKSGMLGVDCTVDLNVIRDDEVNLQSDGSRWVTIAIQGGSTGSARCNTWGDGSFIPDRLVVGVTHDVSGCP